MGWWHDPGIWAGLAILFVLEIVLGMDNLVYLALLTARLPDRQRGLAEKSGLALALGFRLGLLALAVWLVGLTRPVLTVFGHPFGWHDLVLAVGGVLLVAKTAHEVHGALEGGEDGPVGDDGRDAVGLKAVIVQAALLDAVFSVDAVLIALGLLTRPWAMAAAIVAAMAVMVAAGPVVSVFLDRHPAIRMLALSCLLMVGMAMMAGGFGLTIPGPYLYAAIAVVAAVAGVNLLIRARGSGAAIGNR